MPPVLLLLLLLLAANGAPIIANRWLGARLSRPIDGGLVLKDGRYLFGPSKTVRGVVAAIVASVIAAQLMGFPVTIGVLAGACAMLGDLLSSFIKRRLDIESSKQALGLDQIPEALIPAFALRRTLDLTIGDTIAVVGAFFALELLLSRFLYRLGIREHPY
jgi:hypothetical protein